METMIAHMLGVGKAVDDRGLLLPAQVEKERPDYFAIASCIQEDGKTSDPFLLISLRPRADVVHCRCDHR